MSKGLTPLPFAQLRLHDNLVRGVRTLGFPRPTPIQQEAIPPALEGRDVLACATTGSGKTAAFLLPILHSLSGKPRGTTRALVLTPTRELAQQIADHAKALAVHTPFSAAAIYGGVGMGPQEHAFRRGVDIIVATPGRLLDHFRFPYARLQGLETLVLDEADRMLDMGFIPDIKRILKHIPAKRQTLLFSATLPPQIVTLARELLRDPATISLERKVTPAVGITQAAYPVPAQLKSALLVELIKRGEIRSVIAFTRTKHRANRLADYLARNGVSAGRIHGTRSQAQRTAALSDFKAGKFPVLVATDIAARGIDVEALSHVINFDVPNSPEDYVHRVGRTGRVELTGDAFLFVSPEEEANVSRIERVLGTRLPRVTLPGFDYTMKPAEKLEIPLGQRLALMRAQRRHHDSRPLHRGAAQAQGRAPWRRPRPGMGGTERGPA
ncbi:MAG TPA: DEAD/DEAH box helicase [Vicinamibacteria bacterium]|jgi:ATP-dependent RNA helicase RhlE|nr:DEAD/DEAH box helicase [Vicinamibacteria bacterium]